MKAPDQGPPRRTPVQAALDFAGSIWTGVALMAVLFVYSSVGSAVPQLRQLRLFEMTEFEWFHWWPFKALVGLVCLSMTIATLRRIPLRPTTYGVWTIHTGVLVLAAGSVLYFSTKVEGDVPVARRMVTARLGGATAGMVAFPGHGVTIGPPEDSRRLQVAAIDPQWEILSGDDRGKRAYKVSVLVTAPQRTYMRELLAGYPAYTEDLVRSPDSGGPPWVRAKKSLGTPLVDESLDLTLDYAPQEWFYLSGDLQKVWAIYLREAGPVPGPWIERPIHGLPLYNDYVADAGDVWSMPGALRPDPLHVVIPPAAAGDPMPGADIVATSYLRYAVLEPRRRQGGARFDPAVTVRLEASDGRGQVYDLAALDPVQKMEPGGRMAFEWAPTQEAFDALLREPTLRIRVPAAGVDLEAPIRRTLQADPELPFEPIPGTGYSYRVRTFHDGLQIAAGDVISLAVVEVRAGDRSFVRWVSDDRARTRDLPMEGDPAAGHGMALALDEGIVMEYAPGPRMISIVAGPAPEDLRLVTQTAGGPPAVRPIIVGSPLPLSESVSLTVLRYAPNTLMETRPFIAPPEQRDREAKAQFSMIQVAVPGVAEPVWLRYHLWPFESDVLAFGRAHWQPTVLDLPGGKRVEMIFSRQRRPLPAPVVLDDFVMDTNIGGYTGGSLSVLNWTSRVRFREAEPAAWSEPLLVSLNDPKEWGGLSYFQAQWDPPQPQNDYAGLNYTVLGVGSRHGVNVMLLGCCMTVLGMMYAFYVKPVIKRRRAAASAAAPARAPEGAPPRALAPVAAGKEGP